MYPSQMPKVSGPAPKFNDYHIWKAIVSMDDTEYFGRKRLASLLRIGEGSTRTLIERLTEQGLVIVDKKGIRLTEMGIKTKNDLYMEIVPVDTFDLTIGKYDYAVLLKRASKRITFGCEERDSAILSGALGATTLVASNGHLMFPGNDYPVDEENERSLRKALDIKNDDVIIIGTADDCEKAECGAVSAALNVMGGLSMKKRLNELLEPNARTKELLSLAFAIHELIGGFPVCAKTTNDLGVRIENGTVIDNAYTGELLEKAISECRTIRCVATTGPYKGMSVIVTPIELNGNVIASIGVVDMEDILINAHP